MINKEKITTASVGTYIQKEKMISFFNCLLKKDMHLNLNATNKNTLKRINNVISSIAIGCKKRVAKIAKKRLSSVKYPHQYILALYFFYYHIYYLANLIIKSASSSSVMKNGFKYIFWVMNGSIMKYIISRFLSYKTA